MTPALRFLAAGRRLRGAPIDPFGDLADRRLERELIADYEWDLQRLRGPERSDGVAAAAFLSWPLKVRGYGAVKAASVPSGSQRQALFAAVTGTGRGGVM